jgi:hypothetical protein
MFFQPRHVGKGFPTYISGSLTLNRKTLYRPEFDSGAAKTIAQ